MRCKKWQTTNVTETRLYCLAWFRFIPLDSFIRKQAVRTGIRTVGMND